MQKLRRGAIALAIIATAALAAGCGPKPNIVALGMDVHWHGTTRDATAYIVNTGTVDAGAFLVYFDADENPVSERDRPQVRLTVPGLAAGQRLALSADFTPLATNLNLQLARVRSVTVLVDPKTQIPENDENDNSLVTNITGPGQSNAFEGPILRPQGFIKQNAANPLRQTFTVHEGGRLAGIQLTGHTCSTQSQEQMTVVVRQGTMQLGSFNLPLAALPVSCAEGPPATIPAGSGASGFIETTANTITLTPDSEFSFELTSTTNGEARMGMASNSYDAGGLTIFGESAGLLDLAFRLYIVH